MAASTRKFKIRGLSTAFKGIIHTFVIGIVVYSVGCSSAKKKTTPELSELLGKKVALVDVEGEDTPKRIVEVALVNQISQRGTFLLVSKEDINTARTSVGVDPSDWKAIAKKAGADYALRAKVLKFDATTREGYSKEEVEDSELAVDQGKSSAKTDRLYKVKSLTGKVEIDLEFANLAKNDLRHAVATAEDQVTAGSKDTAAHLPPKMRFLEKLSNQAFQKFFETY